MAFKKGVNPFATKGKPKFSGPPMGGPSPAPMPGAGGPPPMMAKKGGKLKVAAKKKK